MLVYHPDYKPGQIVLARRVKIGHLGRLAAQQDAGILAAGLGHPLDHRGRHVRLELPGGEVIKEKQRPRALDQNIVYAMVYEVLADRVVDAGIERYFQLCADAVSRGDQDRLGHPGKSAREHPAKTPDLGQRPLVKSAPRKFADLGDGRVGVIDRNPGVRIRN